MSLPQKPPVPHYSFGVLLVLLIRVYRRLRQRAKIPPLCLYSTSCSEHVEEVAHADGLLAALRAVRGRLAACRPGYRIVHDGTVWWVECIDGSRISSEQASSLVKEEARRMGGAGETSPPNAAEVDTPADPGRISPGSSSSFASPLRPLRRFLGLRSLAVSRTPGCRLRRRYQRAHGKTR